MTNHLDYLAARLHGRRSRLAEAERLDALCRLGAIPDLAQTIYPDEEIHTAAGFQRRLVQDLIRELFELTEYLTESEARLLTWMLVRFQVENLKVLARGLATRTPLDVSQQHLILLPADFELGTTALASAESLEDFIELLPEGRLRESVKEAAVMYRDQTAPFFFEAALDRGYFRELLVRVNALSGADQAVIAAMVLQEVDIFHLMLVARGRFLYGLKPEFLLPLHIAGTQIPPKRFAVMLNDPDLVTAVGRAIRRALDALPSKVKGATESSATLDPAVLEALAWNRFLRLANRAFRRSQMDFGVVAGYVVIRRMEVANLITLSEGIRNGMAGETIRARLIPRADLEIAHV